MHCVLYMLHVMYFCMFYVMCLCAVKLIVNPSHVCTYIHEDNPFTRSDHIHLSCSTCVMDYDLSYFPSTAVGMVPQHE